MPETHEAIASQFSIVFDTTVLSNFSAVGELALLEKLYGKTAASTLMVVAEIEEGLAAGYEHLRSVRAASLDPKGWLSVLTLETPRAQALYIELTSSLGAGEAFCLALAYTRDLILATDDLAARRKAGTLHIRLTGTLGILIRSVRENALTLEQANRILARMISLRYRSPVSRLDDLV
jgi:predicted nucleic acid-binding protein